MTYRTIIIGLIALLAVAFGSCTSEEVSPRYEEMKQYHAESLMLPMAPSDSVYRFSVKVDAFVEQHPAAKYDPLYPEIQQHIQENWLRVTIEIDTTWAGETHIYF